MMDREVSSKDNGKYYTRGICEGYHNTHIMRVLCFDQCTLLERHGVCMMNRIVALNLRVEI